MKKLILGVLILILISACSKTEKIPSSFDLIDRINTGEVKQLIVSPPSDVAVYENKAVNAGGTPNLLLGEYEGYETKFLLHFPVEADTIVLESVTLYLYPDTLIGPANSSMHIMVYRVDENWDENELNWHNFNQASAVSLVGETDFLCGDTVKATVPIDTAVVRGWMFDSTMVNRGLLVDYSGASCIQKFHSRETTSTSYRPELELIYFKDAVKDTIVYRPIDDVFITNYDVSLPDDVLFVSNGTGWRSIMKFNLGEIPAEATINYARLVLSINKTSADPPNRLYMDDFEIGLMTVTSDNWDPESVTIDSTLFPPYSFIDLDSDKLTIGKTNDLANLAVIVQEWTSNQLVNNGIILYSLYEGWDISQISFYGSDADSSLVPKMIIEYTVPPQLGN